MLKKITIKSWGQFEKVAISFHPRLTVLVGPNGSGKTRILDFLWEETKNEPALYRVAGPNAYSDSSHKGRGVALKPLPDSPAISDAQGHILQCVFDRSTASYNCPSSISILTRSGGCCPRFSRRSPKRSSSSLRIARSSPRP
jgi:hypothetical protein